MIKVKGPFLGFGKWRIKELLCDVCQSQIDSKSEYVGKIEFSEDYGLIYLRTHCHVECASRMSQEQLLANHHRDFRDGFTLPEWKQRDMAFGNADEEFRLLFDFVQDTTGLLRKIVQCDDCGSIAVVTLPPEVSDPDLKVNYYHIGSSEVHGAPNVCATSLHRGPTGVVIVNRTDCLHDFVRLFRSGDPHVNLAAVRAKSKAKIEIMNKYDHENLAFFGGEVDDIYSADFDDAIGYTWFWCKWCGAIERVLHLRDHKPPICGFSDSSKSGYYGNSKSSGAYGSVTQSRVAGAPVCQVED